ncbi:ParB-like nuclease domain-containing protein [Sphingomonas laterariae]|uniref:ParB-like nuclease domain-containing protein n=1 Tax=Edaphosphingomonas laterariae TaxID=861865 RepID=A0A239EWB0_9SPHN|nr:ParB N-terminal domain-containing protein [Sphingomonas laterariae]SNS48333.1 ParB-like nuclease domain-containing protein [Sphingomonas laterariae]
MKAKHNWKEETLAVSAVRERKDLQNRANGTDPSTVRQYERVLTQGQEMPPVKVAKVGEALYLVDGFHRLAAHRQAGFGAIKAEVAKMSLADAQAVALTANTKHGKRLTRADKDRMLDLYLERRGHIDERGLTKPSRVISAELGGVLSHEALRQKLKARGEALDQDTEFPDGYKPRNAEEDEAALARERHEEAEDLVDALWRTYFTLEEDGRASILAAVQELADRLEREEEPPTPMHHTEAAALLDI